MAINAQVAIAIATKAIKVGRPVGIIDHEQIQPTIVVIVEPAGGNGPLVALDASGFGYVLKSAITQIAIESIAVHTGDKQIRVAVIVIVRRCGAHGIARPRHSGFPGNVSELHSAVVAVKPVEKLG